MYGSKSFVHSFHKKNKQIKFQRWTALYTVLFKSLLKKFLQKVV